MPQTYTFTSPEGDEIEVDSPDGSLPTEAELDQMFQKAMPSEPVAGPGPKIAPPFDLGFSGNNPFEFAGDAMRDFSHTLGDVAGKGKQAIDIGAGMIQDLLPSTPAGLPPGNEAGHLLQQAGDAATNMVAPGFNSVKSAAMAALEKSHPEIAAILGAGGSQLGERASQFITDPGNLVKFGEGAPAFIPGMVEGAGNSILDLLERLDESQGKITPGVARSGADALVDTSMAGVAAMHPAGEIAGRLKKGPVAQQEAPRAPFEENFNTEPVPPPEPPPQAPIPGAEPLEPGDPMHIEEFHEPGGDTSLPTTPSSFESEFSPKAENAAEQLLSEVSPHPVAEKLIAKYQQDRATADTLEQQGLLSKKAADSKRRSAEAGLVTSLLKLKEKLKGSAESTYLEMYPPKDSGTLEEQHAKISPISSENNEPRSSSALIQMADLNEALGKPVKLRGRADQTVATLPMRGEDQSLTSFQMEIPERAGAPNTLSTQIAQSLINGVLNKLPAGLSDQLRQAAQTLIKTGRFAHMEGADPSTSIRGMTLPDSQTGAREVFIQPGEIGRSGMRGVSGNNRITFIKNFIRTVAHEAAHAIDLSGTEHGTAEGEATRLALETQLIDEMENSPIGQGLLNTVTQEGSFANEFSKGFGGKAGKQLAAAQALGGEGALGKQTPGLFIADSEAVPEAAASRGLPERVKAEERKAATGLEEDFAPEDRSDSNDRDLFDHDFGEVRPGEAQLFPWEGEKGLGHKAPTYTSSGKVITTLRTARLNTFAHEIVKGVEGGTIPRDYASILAAAELKLGRRGLRAKDVARATAEHLGVMTPESGAISSRILQDLAAKLSNPGKLLNDLAEGGLAFGASGYLTAMNNTLNSFLDNGTKGVADLVSFLPGYRRAMRAASGIAINPHVAEGHLKGTLTKALNPAAILRDAATGAATFANRQDILPATMTREAAAAIDLTAAGLNPKLFNRIWHYTTSGQHIGLSKAGGGPALTFPQRVTQSALALNLIGDYTHFMATFGKEMVPVLEAAGVDSLSALRDKIKADPTFLNDALKDQILYASTEAMANTAKLGAAGMKRGEGERSIAAMSRTLSDTLSKYPAIQFIAMKYSNYMINNFLPGVMDSMPTALVGKGLLASKRTKNSLAYEDAKRDALAAMNKASAMKAAKDPNLPQFVKETLRPLRNKVKHMQETGVFSEQRVARQALVGPMVAGIWFLLGMTKQNPEEPWDKINVAPHGEGGGKVKESLIGALGAAAPFAYLGYRAAQRMRNVPDSKGKEGFANFATDLSNVVGARLGDFPTLLDLFNTKDVPLDTLYKKVQRYASDMGKLAVKPWQLDLARGLAEKVSPGERIERNPNVAPKGVPGMGQIIGDVPKNFLRGVETGVPFVRQSLPPKYDPTTGKPGSIEGGYGKPYLPDVMLRNQNFSPLREFLDQNQNLISPRDVYLSQTGQPEFDKAAFGYVEKQIPRRILPLLAKKDSKPRDVLIAEVKREMSRINDEARETAEKQAAHNHWMLPPEVIRKTLSEKERERIERQSGLLKRPASQATNLTQGEKARLRLLAEEQE